MQFDESSGIVCFGASIAGSNSSLLHRGGGGAGHTPTLALAPTVGSRVVLTSKESDHDTYIWEDREMDMIYLRCVAQHNLIGDVVRETDTQFLVRFDIPHCYLPFKICDRASPHDGDSGRQHCSEDEEEEDVEVKDSDINEESDDGRDEERVEEERGEIESDAGRRGGVGRISMVRDDVDVESDADLSKTSYFAAGIVPVLTLPQDCLSIPTPRSRAKVLCQTGKSRATFRSADTDGISAVLSSPGPRLSGSNHLHSIGTTMVQNTVLANDRYPNVLHVSLSISKRCCISLLQHLLEQHEKLSSVVSAVGCRDFKMAAQHIMEVIEAQQVLAKKRNDDFKKTIDSRRPSLAWMQVNSQVVLQTDVGRSVDGMTEDRRSRHLKVLRINREDISRVELERLSSSNRNEEERQPSSGDSRNTNLKGEASVINSQKAEATKENSAGCEKVQTVPFLWSYRNIKKELATLFALLSFVHFNDGQFHQSLEDAEAALGHDGTCVEAYTRVLAVFMALGSEREALVTATTATRRCFALSPQFLRLSRVVYVSAFYRRNLVEQSGAYVLPRIRHSGCLGEIGSVLEVATLPKVHRSNRHLTAVRVQKFSYSCTAPMSTVHVDPIALRRLLPGSSPPMDYFSRSQRARAARGFEAGEVVFCEEVSLQILLWSYIALDHDETAVTSFSFPPEEGDQNARAWTSGRLRFCAYCGYPLVSKSVLLEEVCERISKAVSERLRWSFSGREAVECAAGCGERYCGEVCRNRAAVEYHAVECNLFPLDYGNRNQQYYHSQAIVGGETTAKLSLGAVDSCGRLDEFFPHATVPFDRPSVRRLLSIRRYQKRSGCSDSEVLPAEAHSQEPQYDTTVLSKTGIMEGERECQHSCSLETCRTVVQGIRNGFKHYYAGVQTLILDNQSSAVATALLIAGRLIAHMLSVFLPPAALKGPNETCDADGITLSENDSRERSTHIKEIISRYASRGFTSSGTSPSDRYDAHGLGLAEEVLHQIRVPFFADTNLVQPTRVWELLDENPTEENNNKEDISTATGAPTRSIRYGFERLAELLRVIHNFIRENICDEPVAFSIPVTSNFGKSSASGCSGSGVWTKIYSDESRAKRSCGSSQHFTFHSNLSAEVGSLAVWLKEEHNELPSHLSNRLFVWTFGRLLGFLGKRRFMEQLWDFCLSSYCVVPKCVLTFGLGDNIPEHQRKGWEYICRQYTVSVAVMGPLLSVVSDLSALGGDVCSRFFCDSATRGPQNPLFIRKSDSPGASVLSINSCTHEADDTHTWGNTFSMSSNDSRVSSHFPVETMTVGNLETRAYCVFNRSGVRYVTMRARRSIPVGEELRHESRFL